VKFYLGIHQANWLEETTVPCFISYAQVRTWRVWRTVTAPWVLDSGGFTQLRKHGGWTFTPEQYAREVGFLHSLWDGLEWVAPMDWMCEPEQVKRTGLTVVEHQYRTLLNFLTLRQLLGTLVAPVLQGWTPDEYEQHISMYDHAGVDLAAERIVGVGSICRRYQDDKIAAVLAALAPYDLTMHGFGVRGPALIKNAHLLASADSLAWSFDGMFNRLPGHELLHKNCANCLPYGLQWREDLLTRVKEENPCATV
jgi:hypothetical protein